MGTILPEITMFCSLLFKARIDRDKMHDQHSKLLVLWMRGILVQEVFLVGLSIIDVRVSKQAGEEINL